MPFRCGTITTTTVAPSASARCRSVRSDHCSVGSMNGRSLASVAAVASPFCSLASRTTCRRKSYFGIDALLDELREMQAPLLGDREPAEDDHVDVGLEPGRDLQADVEHLGHAIARDAEVQQLELTHRGRGVAGVEIALEQRLPAGARRHPEAARHRVAEQHQPAHAGRLRQRVVLVDEPEPVGDVVDVPEARIAGVEVRQRPVDQEAGEVLVDLDLVGAQLLELRARSGGGAAPPSSPGVRATTSEARFSSSW